MFFQADVVQKLFSSCIGSLESIPAAWNRGYCIGRAQFTLASIPGRSSSPSLDSRPLFLEERPGIEASPCEGG